MDVSHLTCTEQRRVWRRMFPIKWLVICGLIMHSDKLFPGSYLFSCTLYFESIYFSFLFMLVEMMFSYQQRRARIVLDGAPGTLCISKWRLARLSTLYVKLTLEIHLVIVAFTFRDEISGRSRKADAPQ